MKHLTLSTSAVIKQNYIIRKLEYLDSFKFMRDNNIPFKIIETVESSCDFLEEIGDVFYSNTNNNWNNKGAKEFLAIRKFLNNNTINSEWIIKHTGRYLMINTQFYEELDESDIVCKMAPDGQIYTGLFAMKTDIFIDFVQKINLAKIEKHMINIETALQVFASKKNTKYIEQLNIKANINNMDCLFL